MPLITTRPFKTLAIDWTSWTEGASATILTNANGNSWGEFAALDNNKTIHFWGSEAPTNIYAEVLTYSGSTITNNTEIQIESGSGNASANGRLQALSTTLAFAYYYNTTLSQNTLRTLSVSGTTITPNTKVTFGSNRAGAATMLTSGVGMAVSGNSSDAWVLHRFTVTGTTVAVVANNTIVSSGRFSTASGIARIDDNHAVITHRDLTGAGTQIRSYNVNSLTQVGAGGVLHASQGGSTSRITYVNDDSSGNPVFVVTYDIGSNVNVRPVKVNASTYNVTTGTGLVAPGGLGTGSGSANEPLLVAENQVMVFNNGESTVYSIDPDALTISQDSTNTVSFANSFCNIAAIDSPTTRVLARYVNKGRVLTVG